GRVDTISGSDGGSRSRAGQERIDDAHIHGAQGPAILRREFRGAVTGARRRARRRSLLQVAAIEVGAAGMKLLRRGLLAVPFLALASRADAQKQQPLVIPPKWYVVKADGDAFTVEMPGIPDHRIINDATAKGSAFALHSYSLEVGGYSYV